MASKAVLSGELGSVTVSPSVAPTNPILGQMWYDSADGLTSLANVAALQSQIDALTAKQPLTSVIPADVSNNTQTLAPSGLTVDLLPGNYLIRAAGSYRTALTTTGIALSLGGTAVVSSIHYTNTIWGVTATTATSQFITALNAANAPTTGTAAISVSYAFTIDGVVHVTTAGTLRLDFRSEVTSSNVLIGLDSFLTAQVY